VTATRPGLQNPSFMFQISYTPISDRRELSNDAMPSIDIAKRMADVFEVSLDYLVGNSEQEIDKATMNRINEISKMNPTDKNLVYQFMDAFIMKVKLQGVMK
ncbi:MAG: helix-turn-helix transcriptional regulator, partial [Tannerellaceae bacterium]|nr:helix-turn-helix transcriptional regulator [Tannerellaceae bacterium]